MYRLGLSRKRIAELVRAEPATVGYHLVIARRRDPELEAAHLTAAGTNSSPSPASLARMDEIITWISAEHRFPRDRSEDKGEQSMAGGSRTDATKQPEAGFIRPTVTASHESPGGPGTSGQRPTRRGGMTASPSSRTSVPKGTTGPATATTPQTGNTPSVCGSTPSGKSIVAANLSPPRSSSWTALFPAGRSGESAAAHRGNRRGPAPWRQARGTLFLPVDPLRLSSPR
jgi:hypothetical protein